MSKISKFFKGLFSPPTPTPPPPAVVAPKSVSKSKPSKKSIK
jgi:hypothetical protein